MPESRSEDEALAASIQSMRTPRIEISGHSDTPHGRISNPRSFSLSNETAPGAYSEKSLCESPLREMSRTNGGDGPAPEPPTTATKDFAHSPSNCSTGLATQDTSSDIPNPLQAPAAANVLPASPVPDQVPSLGITDNTTLATHEGLPMAEGDLAKDVQGALSLPSVQNTTEISETLNPPGISEDLGAPKMPQTPTALELPKVLEVPRTGIPIDQTGSVRAPPTPTPNLTKRQKAKVSTQRTVRKFRRIFLRRCILTPVLGRELAEPVSVGLKLINKGLSLNMAGGALSTVKGGVPAPVPAAPVPVPN
jgi:hypothetical protein